MACKQGGCNLPGSVRGWCPDHFLNAWWTGSATGDGGALLPGMPEVDMRGMQAGEWRFSVCVIVTDPDYNKKSRAVVIDKMFGRARERRRPAPNTGMGHSYIRFRLPRVAGATRDYLSFGMTANGVSSPDPEAGANRTASEVAVDYAVSDEQKDAICEVISAWMLGHVRGDPEYRYAIMSSNCTRFGRACCKAAKIYFPGSRSPTRSSAGWNLTDSPVNLHATVVTSRYAYDPNRDHPASPAPPTMVAFKASRLRPRRQGQATLEFRSRLEAFKAEYSISRVHDGPAVELMYLMDRVELTPEALRKALETHSPAEIVQLISNP